MSGAISPLPQYALMAWCSVKAQGQLYLLLYLYLFTFSRSTQMRIILKCILMEQVCEDMDWIDSSVVLNTVMN
jgi:hypothetical protein